nr:MAG TPA: hypothetical protein [Caudoviricetes sp.]
MVLRTDLRTKDQKIHFNISDIRANSYIHAIYFVQYSDPRTFYNIN